MKCYKIIAKSLSEWNPNPILLILNVVYSLTYIKRVMWILLLLFFKPLPMNRIRLTFHVYFVPILPIQIFLSISLRTLKSKHWSIAWPLPCAPYNVLTPTNRVLFCPAFEFLPVPLWVVLLLFSRFRINVLTIILEMPS